MGQDEVGWVKSILQKQKKKIFCNTMYNIITPLSLMPATLQIWGEAGIRKWAEKAKEMDFKFCPKMYQGVTHRGSLTRRFSVNEFFRGITF